MTPLPPPSAAELRAWRQARPWYWQWSRGWRLGLVGAGLAAVVSGYVVWRGPQDYRALKAWRGRGLAEKARKVASQGASDEAARLLEEALLLAPRDGDVLRTVADFGEPRQDPQALEALRQMIALGVATEADQERLCRLAFDWGRPEMAPVETIKTWVGLPIDELGIGKLGPVARWLAARGLEAEAEQRLRRALALVPPDGPDQPRLNLALGGLLASHATGIPPPERLQEAQTRWIEVARNDAARPARQEQALQTVLALWSLSEGRALRTPEVVSDLRSLLQERSATAPAAEKMRFRLLTAGLELSADPDGRQAVAAKLVEEAADEPTGRLALCRWLIQQGFSAEALSVCNRDGRAATDRDWFIARLDSLFGQRAWDQISQTLEAPDQPLPALVKALFLLRNDLAAGREETVLRSRRAAVAEAARTAEAGDVLYAAGNLEQAGQTDVAMTLYRQIQHHQQVGPSGLLGMVRCLDHHPEMTGELMETLEGVLAVLPQSEDARADLIYLRLIERSSSAEDTAGALRLVRESPQLLGFRIIAALAELRGGRAAEALATISSETLPWDRVRAGWRAVHAAVLAANGQEEKARSLAGALSRAQLKPGEQKLLDEYHLTAQP